MRILLTSFVLTASVLGIHKVQAQGDQQPDLYISNAIQGSERQVMENVISTLPVEDRENVIYVNKEGDVYANKPELKDDIELLTTVKNNVYQNSEGEKFVFPQLEPRPVVTKDTYFSINKVSAPSTCQTDGTGPYRRVYSNTGYSWISMKVHLPSETEIQDSGPNSSTGDTGYIYTGGWGGDQSQAVDAGMQHNTASRNWSGAIRVSGQLPLNMTTRYQPNQDIQMKFYVNANNQVTLVVTGILVDGTKNSQTVTADVQGFTTNGSSNILKRITSIGQNKGKENLSTGSYMNNVHWYNTYIGKSSTSNTAWNSSAQTGGMCSYPNSSKIKVSYVNQGEETVNIHL